MFGIKINLSCTEINVQIKEISSDIILFEMFIRIWADFLLINSIIDVLNNRQDLFVGTLSLNQPRFRSNATWESTATIFANRTTVGSYPRGIFITSKNSIYISDLINDEIHIWENESSVYPSKNIPSSLIDPYSIYVTSNGDIYGDGGANNCIDKWIAENETWVPVMDTSSTCYSLFVDIYENLYCSMYNKHRVDKKWSNGVTTIVAGRGVRGSSLDMLNGPYGIFVDVNLDVYVADSDNSRIQLFRFNQPNGITIAGSESSTLSIELKKPTGIALDGDRYLFIIDGGNHRIVGSNQYGFHCIFGCSGQNLTNNKLNHPIGMAFDSYGNIYVTDEGDHQIKKYIYQKSLIVNINIYFSLYTF